MKSHSTANEGLYFDYKKKIRRNGCKNKEDSAPRSTERYYPSEMFFSIFSEIKTVKYQVASCWRSRIVSRFFGTLSVLEYAYFRWCPYNLITCRYLHRDYDIKIDSNEDSDKIQKMSKFQNFHFIIIVLKAKKFTFFLLEYLIKHFSRKFSSVAHNVNIFYGYD